MKKIFISYRREDSQGFARGLYQSLVGRFGNDYVFMDVDSIGLGMDFVEAIEESLDDCGALLVLIGKEWASCVDSDGTRRLDKSDDFVRIEVAKAIKRNVRVIPVLIKGAPMPEAEDLPEELRSLTRRQALELRHERWNSDVDQLTSALETLLGLERKDHQSDATQAPQAPASRPGGKKGLKITGIVAAVVLGLGIYVYNSFMDTFDTYVEPPPANVPVASVPAPDPAREKTAAPAPLPKVTSLTGLWVDNSGVQVKIVQNGSYAVSQFIEPTSGVMVQANWQFSGRNFEFTWASGAGNKGYGRGTVAADYNSIQYEYIDYVTGLQDSGRLRRAGR